MHQNRWGVLSSLPSDRFNQGPRVSMSNQKPESPWWWFSWPRLATHLFYSLPASKYPERSVQLRQVRQTQVKVGSSAKFPEKSDSFFLQGEMLTVHTDHWPTLRVSHEEWRSCLHKTYTQTPTVAYSSQATCMHMPASESSSARWIQAWVQVARYM